MKDSSGSPTLFLALILFTAACERLPTSEFYEVDGIISANALSVEKQKGWEPVDIPLTASLISQNQIDQRGTLDFTFYIRNPGVYGIWVMGSIYPGSETSSVNIRITDEENFLLERYQLMPDESTIPQWISRDHNGESLFAKFERRGFYTVTVETGGLPGVIIHKLHLTLDNLREPVGMGYPETRSPAVDPVLEKREHTVRIPPGWAFGLLTDRTDYDSWELKADGCTTGIGSCNSFKNRKVDLVSDTKRHDELRLAHKTSMGNESGRGFLLAHAPGLDDPLFKKYPALWFPDGGPGEATIGQQVKRLADPGHPLYEVPYLAFTESSGKDELLRWVQLQAFSNFMFIPLKQIEELLLEQEDERQLLQLVEEYADLRRRLFPYIYSYTLRSRTTREKMITGKRGYPGQYLFGEAFWAAPLVSGEAASRSVRFPEGVWYNYHTHELYEGGQSWIVEEQEYRFPLFVKAGSIIPYRPQAVPIEAGNNEVLILDIYTGDAGTFRLYEDDGISTDYRHGEFSTVAFRWFEHEDYGTFNIGAMVRGFEGQTETRKYKLRFLFAERPVTVTANGDLVDEGRGEGLWHYSEEENALVIDWEQEQRRRTEFKIRFR